MLRNKIKRQEVKAVDPSKDKIKYSILVEGEMDWNKDFADRGYKNEQRTVIDNYHFSSFDDNLKQHILNYVWSAIQDTNLFTQATLNAFDATPEVLNAYTEYKGELNDQQKQKLKTELEEAEKRAAQLRAQLA